MVQDISLVDKKTLETNGIASGRVAPTEGWRGPKLRSKGEYQGKGQRKKNKTERNNYVELCT